MEVWAQPHSLSDWQDRGALEHQPQRELSTRSMSVYCWFDSQCLRILRWGKDNQTVHSVRGRKWESCDVLGTSATEPLQKFQKKIQQVVEVSDTELEQQDSNAGDSATCDNGVLPKSNGVVPNSACDAGGVVPSVDAISTSSSGRVVPSGEDSANSFDIKRCRNTGTPIQVEWDNSFHSFIDGFGLCSPSRWRPQQRGQGRSEEMVRLADSIFKLLADCVDECITDVRLEAFKLVTGRLERSPFPEHALAKLREKWAGLLQDPHDARIVDQGQPFHLRALSQWMKKYYDPDAHWLLDEVDSFASGVYIGVDQPLPRSPQVFPLKTKHRRLDGTELAAVAENYPSAQISSSELESKFREEEALGRMFPSKLGVLKEEYGDRLRIASMAAISKPDGSVRPLHDATHSVMVNHEISSIRTRSFAWAQQRLPA